MELKYMEMHAMNTYINKLQLQHNGSFQMYQKYYRTHT